MLTVYLMGCVLSYFAHRSLMKRLWGIYTVGDKIINTIISCFSFVSLISALIIALFLATQKSFKKEARW